MLKFAAKMTLAVGLLGLSACASWYPKEEPRQPSSYNEESPTPHAAWHYPYFNRVGPAKYY